MLKARDGNALFLILIAVALFAALSYAVTQSGRAGANIDREQKMIDQAVSEQCNASVDYAVNKLKLLNYCQSDEISYELPDGDNPNPNAPADKSCHAFHPNGGGVAPCGAYLGLEFCDLEGLALGEKCPNGDVVYAGDDDGARLYTTAADQGQIKWSNGLTTTGATSTSDGKANTDTLVGLSDAGAPYEAANACRGLGDEWYLPAEAELNVLYTNHAAIGGFNTSGSFPAGLYWSSSEDSANDPRYQRFSDGYQSDNYQKHNALAVRCVRR